MTNRYWPRTHHNMILLVFLIVSFWNRYQALALGPVEKTEATNHFKQKNYNKVEEILMPHLADLERPEILILGRALSENKNSLMAQKVFVAGLSKVPNDSELKSLLGLELFKAGKDSEAILTLKEILVKNKSYLPAYQYMIQVFEKKKNRYELRLLYQDMVEQFGEKFDLISKLCELTTQDAHYELALKYCRTGVRLNSREPNNSIYLGIALKDQMKSEEAENILKRTADSFSKSELAQITYGQILADKRNYIESFKYFQRGISANPKSERALLGVGISGVEIQKHEEALKAFSKLCKITKTSLPDFRRAAINLRTAKNSSWATKFENAIEQCN